MVVTLQTFNKVKQIYLGQIRQKFPEVNSSWVSFYLGVKKFGEGRTTEIDSQGFHAHRNFWCVNSRRQDSSGSSRSKMHLSFYLTVISYANSEIKGKMQTTHAPPPQILSQCEVCLVLSSRPSPPSVSWLATSVLHFFLAIP